MSDKKTPKPTRVTRELEPEEKSLWNYAVRDTAPLRPTAVRGAPDPRSPFMQALQKKSQAGPRSIIPLAGSELRPKMNNKPLSALDRRTSQKLRSGRIPIDATLDLHGFRQAEAHSRLIRFIEQGQRQGFKCVLVITGKGGPGASDPPRGPERTRGVLRTALPQWLQTAPLDRYVVKYQAAHIRHGGAGAYYLFLRKAERL